MKFETFLAFAGCIAAGTVQAQSTAPSKLVARTNASQILTEIEDAVTCDACEVDEFSLLYFR